MTCPVSGCMKNSGIDIHIHNITIPSEVLTWGVAVDGLVEYPEVEWRQAQQL